MVRENCLVYIGIQQICVSSSCLKDDSNSYSFILTFLDQFMEMHAYSYSRNELYTNLEILRQNAPTFLPQPVHESSFCKRRISPMRTKGNVRRLLPRDYAMLMAFPDFYAELHSMSALRAEKKDSGEDRKGGKFDDAYMLHRV